MGVKSNLLSPQSGGVGSKARSIEGPESSVTRAALGPEVLCCDHSGGSVQLESLIKVTHLWLRRAP